MDYQLATNCKNTCHTYEKEVISVGLLKSHRKI